MKLNRPAIFSLWLGVTTAAVHAEDGQVSTALDRFLSRWSSGPHIEAADVNELYAPTVNYYGRRRSRVQITREKQSIADKWPNRRYTIDPKSVSSQSTPDRTHCVVEGVLGWSVANGSRKGNSGASSLTLALIRADPGHHIVSESGSVIIRVAPRR